MGAKNVDGQGPDTEGRIGIYTPEERARRDATPWTLVQGILAPAQFLAFAVSLVLILNYLANGTGYTAAVLSILVKTAFLFAIMITGAIWEKVVFGRYLFARAFFWEDVVSMLVIALHGAYIACWFLNWLTPREQMWLAVAAYASYVINAVQFLAKFRIARRSGGDGEKAGTGFDLALAKVEESTA